ncbi:MAG: gamma-glutamyltransferase [Alphaproteobacteria bacterium]|nr:gamma-glutamyltransferase [Alphaproteobacteria bacterium]
MVAADHAAASRCGAEILEQGGNAADAAVAAALCAGVVQPAGSGLGGGGFAVVVSDRAPGGAVLDFREVAPAAATRDMYRGEHGVVDASASVDGGRAVAVPGESRGLARLLAEHGSLPARRVAAPAVRLARRGFFVEAHLAHALERPVGDEVRAELGVDGQAPAVGARLRRPALARTLSRWARTHGDDLHDGRGADLLVDHVASAGGLLTAEDLAAYAPRDRAPVVVPYRQWTVVTMPPPSSGGVALAQVLGVLAEEEDLGELGWGSAAYLHRITEAMKHAYADRARHLGDPDHVDVPVERLLSEARRDEILGAFDPARTLPPEAYGELLAPPVDGGTQHISVVDGAGRAVALTTTINTVFGSRLVPPRLGVVLNNEMDDFAAAPGVPNTWGLVGAEANAIAPGKRPLSSMSPTIVLDDQGRVVLVVGASGGSTIISGTLQVLLGVLDFGLTPEEALAAPRVHHQWLPDQLVVEPTLAPEVRDALVALGHDVVVRPGFTAVQAIVVSPRREARGASDPRKGGRPAEAWAR